MLEEVFFIIEKLKKALAVRHIVQTEKEIMKRELDSLRTKQARLEAEYTPHKKQGHEKKALEFQLKEMKRSMVGYREFLLLPEIRPLHLEFVERKRTEQLRRQEEERQRREQKARNSERWQAMTAVVRGCAKTSAGNLRTGRRYGPSCFTE